MSMWRIAEIAKHCGGTLHGPIAPEAVVNHIVMDSGMVEDGSLFFALPGARVDGHQFLESVYTAGALCAVVSRPARDGRPYILVEDTDAALWALGAAAVERHRGKRIAITGSAGKTTTKEMLAAALSATAPTFKTLKSYNGQRGVPLMLVNMPADVPYAVLEVGMDRPGEIEKLSRLVKPHAAMITCITEAHIEAFGTMEGIALEKSAIMAGLDPQEGIALLPADEPVVLREARRWKIHHVALWGESASASIRLISYVPAGASSLVTAQLGSETVTYTLPIVGRHMAQNSVAVLAMVNLLEASVSKAMVALAQFNPAPGRGVSNGGRYQGHGLIIIDESYNAHPASMRAALSAFTDQFGQQTVQKIAVLGEMKELGDWGPERHRELGEELKTLGIDGVIAVGPLMHHLYEVLLPAQRIAYVRTAGEVMAHLLPRLNQNTIIFIKGSRSVGLDVVVNELNALLLPIAEEDEGYVV